MQINKIEIDGFRSLKGFKAEGFGDINAFYGLNDTGKSNILAFLEILFKRKLREEEVSFITEGRQETRREDRPVHFWQGKVKDFGDNFFKNEASEITFRVLLTLTNDEIRPLLEVKIKSSKNAVIMEGIITKQAVPGEASFRINKVMLDDKVLFVFTDGTYEYIPSLKEVEGSKKTEAVDKFLIQFNDAVRVISSRRFITEEQEDSSKDSHKDFILNTHRFQNWMFKLSLDRDKYSVFQKVKTWFNGSPFNYGEISFARMSGNMLEIMIEKNGLALPINRHGSGVQQLLMLLSYIADSNSKIIGIEEIEINLSPKLQLEVLGRLKSFLNAPQSPINQLFLVSHSERYDVPAVKKYYTILDNGITKVRGWDEETKKEWLGSGLWYQD